MGGWVNAGAHFFSLAVIVGSREHHALVTELGDRR